MAGGDNGLAEPCASAGHAARGIGVLAEGAACWGRSGGGRRGVGVVRGHAEGQGGGVGEGYEGVVSQASGADGAPMCAGGRQWWEWQRDRAGDDSAAGGGG